MSSVIDTVLLDKNKSFLGGTTPLRTYSGVPRLQEETSYFKKTLFE